MLCIVGSVMYNLQFLALWNCDTDSDLGDFIANISEIYGDPGDDRRPSKLLGYFFIGYL